MWFLILASCLAFASAEPVHIHYEPLYHGPPAPLDKIGRVVDTPEVAHAKAAHFAAYHAEAAKVHHSYAPVYHQVGSDGGSSHGEVHHYHGPPAPLGHDGRVVDTPEVAHAKSAHFAAVQEELAKVSHHSPHPSAGGHY